MRYASATVGSVRLPSETQVVAGDQFSKDRSAARRLQAGMGEKISAYIQEEDTTDAGSGASNIEVSSTSLGASGDEQWEAQRESRRNAATAWLQQQQQQQQQWQQQQQRQHRQQRHQQPPSDAARQGGRAPRTRRSRKEEPTPLRCALRAKGNTVLAQLAADSGKAGWGKPPRRPQEAPLRVSPGMEPYRNEPRDARGEMTTRAEFTSPTPTEDPNMPAKVPMPKYLNYAMCDDTLWQHSQLSMVKSTDGSISGEVLARMAL